MSPSPDAVDGPDLYSTSIEHRAFGDVLIDTCAVPFRDTEAVRALTLTGSTVDGGGWLAFGFGFAVGFGVEVGFFVAGALVVDGADGAVVAPVGVAAPPSSPNAAGRRRRQRGR